MKDRERKRLLKIDHPKASGAAAEEARRRQLADDDDANVRTVSQSLHFRQGLSDKT